MTVISMMLSSKNNAKVIKQVKSEKRKVKKNEK
jgi:hypothetical protein